MATLYKFGKRQRNGDPCNLKTVWSSSPRPAEALIGIMLEKREDPEQSAKLFFSVDEALALERQLHNLRYYHLAALHGFDSETATYIMKCDFLKAARHIRRIENWGAVQKGDGLTPLMRIKRRIEAFLIDWKKMNLWRLDPETSITLPSHDIGLENG